jgi:hypothetical protein
MEFYRPVAPTPEPEQAAKTSAEPAAAPEVVGSASWDGSRLEIEALDEEVRGALRTIFRRTALATEDASLRRRGTSGTVLLQPGTNEWFRAAAFERAPDVGLVARAVPGVEEGGGWDPAAQSTTFRRSVDRLETGRS